MKQIIKFIGKSLLAAVVAMVVVCVLGVIDVSDRVLVVVYFVVAVIAAALLGAFDSASRAKHDSIRHKTGRNYGQAA